MKRARSKFDSLLAGGKPLEIFARVIAEQGGDPKVVEDYSRLPSAQQEDSDRGPEDGWVAGLEAVTVGGRRWFWAAGANGWIP